jgi:hypothetical protein
VRTVRTRYKDLLKVSMKVGFRFGLVVVDSQPEGQVFISGDAALPMVDVLSLSTHSEPRPHLQSAVSSATFEEILL